MARKTEATETGEADGVYFGLMSGTSMDGVDGIAVQFTAASRPACSARRTSGSRKVCATHFSPLQAPGDNELEREALAANALATRYAVCCHELESLSGYSAAKVRAIGVHGQTVRHRPEKGYTRQINNPALLTEMTNIDIVADFRSRDVAAGGQAHRLSRHFMRPFLAARTRRGWSAIWGASATLRSSANGSVHGFDCGPANALLDEWAHRAFEKAPSTKADISRHRASASPAVERAARRALFRARAAESTGRDLFNPRGSMRARGFRERSRQKTCRRRLSR